MSEHILVVDDEEIVRSGLEANLLAHGFRVTAAMSGAEAMRVMKQDRPDLALCDLVLEDINGIELMKQVREAYPETAVILITGHGSIKNALDALRNGAADYIQKPADPEEVIHRIRTVLHAVGLRRALESERAKMESKKRELSQQQMRHNRMTAVGLMAEGAAHALSNILRPVLNYTPTIRDALPPGNPARELIREVEDAGVKAEELLGDLHYIGTGAGVEKTAVDVASLLAGVAGGSAAAALRDARPGLKLQLDLDENLAAIEASAPLLQRALNNLVAFAAETLPPENALISIAATTQRLERPSGRYGPGKPGTYVVLTIGDNGPGLSVEDLDRLFEPFYTLRLGRSISGLALPLVYRVVADHGGSLDVTSASGRGTSFVIYFPALGSRREEPVDLRADYSGGETILLVDDSDEHRGLAAGILKQQGYRVIPVANGHQALEQLELSLQEGGAGRIDLAVIDFVLADPMDGFETFKKMVEVRPRQKAVLVSGFADLARLTEARRTGIGRIIQKPYTQEGLTRAVREVLDT